MYLILFHQLRLKANTVNQAILLWMTIGKLNVQIVTAANEEQYVLRNIIHIKFPNWYSFIDIYFETEASKIWKKYLKKTCNGVHLFDKNAS